MTTTHRNRSRPIGHSTVHQSQHTPPSNNSRGIQIRYFSFITIKKPKSTFRFGNNQSSTSMPKPQSILKKQRHDKPYVDRFNESVTDWHQPNGLDLMPVKPTYSPIGTPPRLRT